MQQRDLILAEIEKLGEVLRKILASFFNSSKDQNVFESTNQALRSELNIEVDLILTLPKEKLSAYFKLKKVAPKHIELLAEYFDKAGDVIFPKSKEEGIILYQKCLELLDLVNNDTNEYSLERLQKEKKVKEKVEKLTL